MRATVTATGADGTTFSANATPSAFDLSTRVGSLGYAHDKIGELMKAAEGERAIGAGDEEESLHARALALALESGVVWPGLTAMVTNSSAVDAAACQAIMRPNTATPVCSDGSVVGASASEADFDTAAGCATPLDANSMIVSNARRHGRNDVPVAHCLLGLLLSVQLVLVFLHLCLG